MRFRLFLGWICAIGAAALIVLAGREDLPSGLQRSNEPGVYDSGVWDPLIVRDVNRRGLSVMQGIRKRDDLVYPLYMDSGKRPVISLYSFKQLMGCAAYFTGNDLTVESRGQTYTFNPEEIVTVPGSGQPYLYLDTASEKLGVAGMYSGRDYAWTFDTADAGITLPSRYDYRDVYRASVVKDQESEGTCWAMAMTTALETSLRPAETAVLSPDHVSRKNAFGLALDEGGNYFISRAYLSSWQGPVKEADDPYGDGVSPDHLSPACHVQQMQMFFHKDPELIKRFVYQYGGVETSLYCDLESEESYSPYYSSENASYCYTGAEDANHDIVVIGWDDGFPADRFPVPVSRPGAFICQNSWGGTFGDGGVFYVSYEDTSIGESGIVYSVAERTDNYSHLYQTDLLGWTGNIGYDEDAAYAANVYTADSPQEIAAVGLTAVEAGTRYEVYTAASFDGAESLEKAVFESAPAAEGFLPEAGYYTIPLRKTVPVEAGRPFAAIVRLEIRGYGQPVAVEYAADQYTRNADLGDGEGYISFDGRYWTDTESEDECNVCLKVYTNDR